MRILIGNKFWYPKGGVETYLHDLVRELPAYGHETIPFAMADPRNWSTPYAEHFVDTTDYSDRRLSLENLRNGARIFYSSHARRKITRLLEVEKPELAHLHNIYHQISPSILPALKEFGIPILMTLHDLKLACPNYKMRTHGNVCERCVPGKFYHAVLNRCVKDSTLASALCALELYVHRHLDIYRKHVDKFIVPSEFYRVKFVQSGIPESRLTHIPNFTRVESYEPAYEAADCFVYMGRLSEEKGLTTLLRAMRGIDRGRLLILGDGPLRGDLVRLIAELDLNNVSLMGSKWGDELRRIIASARFTIIPSEWYENCPMSCIESFASGKPVIGADIGGIPELIEDGVTGLLFEAGNVEQLRDAIEQLYASPRLVREMGKTARLRAETEYSVQAHMRRLLREYSAPFFAQDGACSRQTRSIGG